LSTATSHATVHYTIMVKQMQVHQWRKRKFEKLSIGMKGKNNYVLPVNPIEEVDQFHTHMRFDLGKDFNERLCSWRGRGSATNREKKR
jgi:hypothetical protein